MLFCFPNIQLQVAAMKRFSLHSGNLWSKGNSEPVSIGAPGLLGNDA